MITIKQLLKRPVFKVAKIIAGKQGLIRKVGWVHVLEISTSAPFTNENDLILTTGIGFNGDEERAYSYMKSLISQGASGLCIELGSYMPTVSDRLIELADTFQFPLIVFTKTVRFVDITQDVHGLLINEQHQRLKEVEQYARKLQQLSLKTTDYFPIVKSLHEQTNNQVYFFNLMEKNLFFPPLSEEVRLDITQFYEESTWLQKNEVTIEMLGQKKVIIQPIQCFGQIVAHLCLGIENEMEETRILIDYTGSTLSQLLMRTLYIEERRGRHQHELMEELMKGTIHREEEFLSQLGLPPLEKGYEYIGGMIEIHQNEKGITAPQDAYILVRSQLNRQGFFSLCMLKNQCIWIFLIKRVDNRDRYKEKIKLVIQGLERHLQEETFQYGFSSRKERIKESATCFQEAMQTLSVYRSRRTSYFYSELGIYQLIKSISNEELLKSYVNKQLGQLIRYDIDNETELVKTLDVLLRCQGAKQEAAKILFIHRQTLYHRLERLEELLGEDYLGSEKRLALEMALRIKELYTL